MISLDELLEPEDVEFNPSPNEVSIKSVYDGLFDEPEEEPLGVIGGVGKGLTHGTLGLGESVGTGLQWLGGRTGIESLADVGEEASEFWGEKAEKYAPPEEIQGDLFEKPELLANATWWAYNVSDMVPALVATMLPAGILGKGMQGLAKTKEAGVRLAKIGQRIGAFVAGGGLEGTQTYKEVLSNGGSEEEAARAMEFMGLFAGALNAVATPKILEKASGSFLRKLSSIAGAGAWEGITEGLEEPSEVFAKVLSKMVNGEPVPDDIGEQLIQSLKDAVTVAPIAALTGGGGAVISNMETDLSDLSDDDLIDRAMGAGSGTRKRRQIIQELVNRKYKGDIPKPKEETNKDLRAITDEKGVTTPEQEEKAPEPIKETPEVEKEEAAEGIDFTGIIGVETLKKQIPFNEIKKQAKEWGLEVEKEEGKSKATSTREAVFKEAFNRGIIEPEDDVKTFIHNKIKMLGDIESVNREWPSDKLPDMYARKIAEDVLSENVETEEVKTEESEKKEEPSTVHDYSSTQIDLPEEHATAIKEFSKNIPESELYIEPEDDQYGREENPHVTVRYGLDTVETDDVAPAFEGMGPIKAKFGKVSIFETDDYDVVKVDIESDDLKEANKRVGDTVDLPGETYKEYIPHATIAYVKKGEGQKYVGNTSLEGKEVTVDNITFSGKDGKMKKIPLTVKKESKKIITPKKTVKAKKKTEVSIPGKHEDVKPEHGEGITYNGRNAGVALREADNNIMAYQEVKNIVESGKLKGLKTLKKALEGKHGLKGVDLKEVRKAVSKAKKAIDDAQRDARIEAVKTKMPQIDRDGFIAKARIDAIDILLSEAKKEREKVATYIINEPPVSNKKGYPPFIQFVIDIGGLYLEDPTFGSDIKALRYTFKRHKNGVTKRTFVKGVPHSLFWKPTKEHPTPKYMDEIAAQAVEAGLVLGVGRELNYGPMEYTDDDFWEEFKRQFSKIGEDIDWTISEEDMVLNQLEKEALEHEKQIDDDYLFSMEEFYREQGLTEDEAKQEAQRDLERIHAEEEGELKEATISEVEEEWSDYEASEEYENSEPEVTDLLDETYDETSRLAEEDYLERRIRFATEYDDFAKEMREKYGEGRWRFDLKEDELKKHDELYKDIGKELYKQYKDNFGDDVPVLIRRMDDGFLQGVIIHKSTKKPGRWQITYWDKRGFSGDTNEATIEKAFKEAYYEGYKTPAPILFDQISKTPEFFEGIKRADEVQKWNREQIKKSEENKKKKPKLSERDYLEVMDMDNEELMTYSLKELKETANQLNSELNNPYPKIGATKKTVIKDIGNIVNDLHEQEKAGEPKREPLVLAPDELTDAEKIAIRKQKGEIKAPDKLGEKPKPKISTEKIKPPTTGKQEGMFEGQEDQESLLRLSSKTKGPPLTTRQVRQIITPFISGWDDTLSVRVVSDPKRALTKGQIVRMDKATPGWRKSKLRGIMTKSEGGRPTVILFASSFVDPKQVIRTLFHEARGHYSLRSTFNSKEFIALLSDVWLTKGEEVLGSIGERYFREKWNPKDVRQQRIVAEEYLARMAESGEDPNLLKRLYAIIRNMLRDMGITLEITDDDLKAIVSGAARKTLGKIGKRIDIGGGVSLSLTGTARKLYVGPRGKKEDPNFSKAVERQAKGEDAGPDSEIRKETGWMINPYDNTWVFEIDDSKAKIIPDPIMGKSDFGTQKALSEVIDHPELFKTYPDLKDVIVSLEVNSSEKYSHGQAYVDEYGQEYIDIEVPSMDDLMITLIHEVQHIIQGNKYEEGRGQGGSQGDKKIRDLAIKLAEEGQEREIAGLKAAIDHITERLNRHIKRRRKAGDKRDWFALQVEYWDKHPTLEKELNAAMSRQIIMSGYLDKKAGEISYDLYNRLSGEIEARDAAERVGLSAKERKMITPYVGQGIPVEDVVVKKEGEGVSKSTPEKKSKAVLRVEKRAKELVKDWKNAPNIFTVDRYEDIPEDARESAQQLTDVDKRTRALFHVDDKGTRNVYLIARVLESKKDVAHAIAHEVLGHDGLRQALGPQFDKYLDQLWTENEKSITNYVNENNLGIELESKEGKREATDEWMADQIANESLPTQIWNKIIRMVRRWVRGIFPDLELSRAELKYLARNAVIMGSGYSTIEGDVLRRQTTARKSLIKPKQRPLGDLFGVADKPILQKATDAWKAGMKNYKTRLFDRLHPIKELLGETAYMLHRLETGSQAVIAMFMRHGKLRWDGKAISADERKDGFLTWLKSLGEDADKLFYWIAAKRAEYLEGQDKESWLTEDQRQRIYDYVGATPKNSRSWEALERKYNEYNNSVLDLATEAGLINRNNRESWEQYHYLPFYRIFEDEKTRSEFLQGPRMSKKHIDAQIRELKGAEMKLGDPLENIIKNWSHLIQESMRNMSRAEAFDSANRLNLNTGTLDKYGKPVKVIKEMSRKELTRVLGSSKKTEYAVIKGDNTRATRVFPTEEMARDWMEGKEGYHIDKRKVISVNFGNSLENNILSFQMEGKRVSFQVNDPELFNAMSGMNAKDFDNIIMKMFGLAKKALTYGATFGPAFRIANMIRDSLQTAVVSKSFYPLLDTIKGFAKAMREDQDYVKFMASGGGFGTSYVKAEDPKALSKYIDRIVKKEGKSATKRILDTPIKVLQFWEKIGSASENAARVALYSKRRKEGKSHLEASFEGRDILDFTMRGDAGAVQFLIQMIPFLNARGQGLYKLGRALNADPINFAWKGGLITLASMVLWAFNHDEDEYKELEDWDKWTYYHFWVGDMHYRIPKPFEVGAIFSTLFESAADTMTEEEDIGYFKDTLMQIWLDTFAFNPTPQLVRPLIEQWANKSLFTGRPIEGVTMQRMLPEERKTPWTSETAQVVGKYTGRAIGFGPKRVETLVKGYLATVGVFSLSMSDMMFRLFTDFPTPPSMKIDDMPGIGRFIKHKDAQHHTKYTTDVYKTLDEVNKTLTTIKAYKVTGDFKAAQNLIERKREKLKNRGPLSKGRKKLTAIYNRMNKIMDSDMPSDEKRKRVDELVNQRNKIVKKLYELYT